MPQHNKHRSPAFLLRSAAALFVVLGLVLVAWLADKAIRYPDIQARQFDSVAPLWLPMIVFICACVAAVCTLFLYAARRVERGDAPPAGPAAAARDRSQDSR